MEIYGHTKCTIIKEKYSENFNAYTGITRKHDEITKAGEVGIIKPKLSKSITPVKQRSKWQTNPNVNIVLENNIPKGYRKFIRKGKEILVSITDKTDVREA